MNNNFTPVIEDKTVKFTLDGRLDTSNAPDLTNELKKLIGTEIDDVVFFVENLEYISSAGLRAIVFAKQKMGSNTNVYIINPTDEVMDVITMTGFDSFLIIQDEY